MGLVWAVGGAVVGGPIELMDNVLPGGVFAGTTTLWSALAASGSLALARPTEDRALLAVGTDVADAGLGEREAHERLGRGD